MSPKFYETAKFKKLNQKWQEKLKKSGFNEQEQPYELTNSEGMTKTNDKLKNWAGNIFRGRYNVTQYEARVTYYRLAGQFLHDHTFDNQLEKDVWELHTKGLSLPKIDAATGKKMGKCKRIVAKLAKVMMEKVKDEEYE